MLRPRFQLWLACFLSLVSVALALDPGLVCNYGNATLDPNSAVPYFQARFPDIQVKAPTRSPWLGGRNQTWCCIQTIDQYLHNNCTNTEHVIVDQRILDDNVQMPCGAVWAGDVAGAPKVKTTAAWSLRTCPGWQVSEPHKVSEWAQLLVAFILPAVVFSFNIPRPRKLKISERLFPTEIVSYRMFAGVLGALGAAVCVSIDAITWLLVSFAFAGPLMLSGLYEAQLDKRVLHFLHEHIRHDELPLALRARILFTILCGNLSLYPAWSDTMDLARHLDEFDKELPEFQHHHHHPPAPRIQVSSASSERLIPKTLEASEPFKFDFTVRSRQADELSNIDCIDTVERHQDTEPLFLTPEGNPGFHPGSSIPDRDTSQRVSQDDTSLSQIRTVSSLADTEPGGSFETNRLERVVTRYDRKRSIKKVAVRLRAMLMCQYSFGSTIGGPVVFFLGSFIYALLEIRSDVGDENIAEALAFGMWWIIIPHVAAVAGLLLAGNNPNILEGIVSMREYKYAFGENLIRRRIEHQATWDAEAPERLARESFKKTKAYSNLMERVYDAVYTPAWMWDRGKCKQDWLLVLFADSWIKYKKDEGIPRSIRIPLERFLTEAIMLSLGDWLFLWAFAFFLIFVPCMFGFLTAYYTPEVGIGCRALTFLTYMVAQTLLLLLWTYYLTKRDHYWDIAWKIKKILPGRLSTRRYQGPELEVLIEKLKAQAKRDTTMSGNQKKRLYESQGRRFSLLLNRSDIGRNIVEIMDAEHPVMKWTFYGLCTVGFAISLLTSVGGTLMQIMGVYRNGFCLTNTPNWTREKLQVTVVTLSTNTNEAISGAQRHWIIIGSFSTVFLGVICYVGWWYQKGLRNMFRIIANELDGIQEEQDMQEMSRYKQSRYEQTRGEQAQYTHV